MSMTINDSLLRSPRGSGDAVLSFAEARNARRMDALKAYVKEIFRLAPKVGLDPAILAAQGALETGNWTSDWWAERLNPAGIGITGDPADNAVSRTWENGTDAARAQIVHLFVYAAGKIEDGHELEQHIDLDPRYRNVINAGWAGTVHSIRGLVEKWAMDPAYASKIVERGNIIFPQLDSEPLGGHVPKPPVVQSWVLDKIIGVGRDPDQPRAGLIVGSCHHTMDGFLLGTDTWFHRQDIASLTDYGIGGPWDSDALDGVIYEWIDPNSQVIPWANGRVADVTAPYGDAPAFLDLFGTNGVNRRLRSIETSDGKDPDRKKSGRLIESLCFLTAWIHAEQAGQTADTFTWNLHHREFGVAHQQCPGAWIINHVDEIQARTKAIMRAYQQGTPLDPPLQVTYPPNWTGPKVPEPGDVAPPSFERFDNPRTFHAVAGAIGRRGPSRDFQVVREYAVGETLSSDGFYHGQTVNGEDRWLRVTGGAGPEIVIHKSGVKEQI